MIDHDKIMKIIAREMGYRFVDLNDNPQGAIVKGAPIAIINGRGVTIDWGWNFEDALKHIPQWLTNDADAIDLLKYVTDYQITRIGQAWECVINNGSENEARSLSGMTTLAYAICDAWLNMKEVNEEWSE